ncbi:MAG: hypothetical protein H8D23_09630 [Candidatus Brocadiales bacterium]|nr:hypothetical protein [Candidatus Brocadiales bacterium]
MRIGEYLVKEEYITEDVLLEALTWQQYNKNMLLGEILIKMKKLSKENLEKYIEDYLNMYKESVLNETSQWLGQDEVDKLRLQFFDPGTA